MSFSLANPLGWASGDLLTPAQINQLDADHAAAIDGTGGGTYTLANPLVLNGATVAIANLTVSSTLTAHDIIGDVAIASGNLDVDGDLSASGEAIIDGNVSVGGLFEVTGTTTLNGTTNILGSTITLGNSASDSIGIAGTVSFSGNGKILEPAILVSTSSTIDSSQYRFIKIPSGTSSITITITSSSTANFDWFEVFNNSSNSQDLAGVVTATMGAGVTFRYRRIAGSWILWD